MQSTDSAKRRIKVGQVCQINNLYIPFTFASSLLTPSPNMLVLESDQPNHQTCFNTVSTTKMQWILVVDITISTTSGYHIFFIMLDKKKCKRKVTLSLNQYNHSKSCQNDGSAYTLTPKKYCNQSSHQASLPVV